MRLLEPELYLMKFEGLGFGVWVRLFATLENALRFLRFMDAFRATSWRDIDRLSFALEPGVFEGLNRQQVLWESGF